MQLQNEDLIKKWEELRLEAYLPTPNDRWTIGWGHTGGVAKGDKITKDQAEVFFQQDVQFAESAINKLVKVDLDQHQYDALVSFVFNVGVENFKTSTLLRKLNAGDETGAAHEFLRWNHQGGKVLKGLTKRRTEEMEYFLDASPEKPTPGVAPDPVPPLRTLLLSKEVWAGATAILTGVSSLLGSVDGLAQDILSAGLTAALLGFGLFIMWNRVSARKKGQR